MTIKVTSKGFDKAKKRRERIAKNFIPVMKRATGHASAKVQAVAQKNISGPILKVQTGRLRQSVLFKVLTRGKSIIGQIGTRVKYGPVHEFGATIKPKSKPYLRFKIKDQWITTKEVKIPARPWLGPALTSSRKDILNIFNNALGKLYRGQV